MIESARIDDAGEFRIIHQIMILLSKLLLAIWLISGSENAYMAPSLTIYQQDATKYTLKKVLSSAVSDAYMVYYYYYPVDRGTDCASRQSDDDFTP